MGQVGGPPRGVQSSMLTSLVLVHDFLFNNSLLTVLAICILAAIIVWATSARRSVKSFPVTVPKTKHGPIQDASSRSTSARSGNDWHRNQNPSSHPKLSTPIRERATTITGNSSSNTQSASSGEAIQPETVHTQKFLGATPAKVNSQGLGNPRSAVRVSAVPRLAVVASKTVSAAPATTRVSPVPSMGTSSSYPSSPSSTSCGSLSSPSWKPSAAGSGPPHEDEESIQTTTTPASFSSSVLSAARTISSAQAVPWSSLPSWGISGLNLSYISEQPTRTDSCSKKQEPRWSTVAALLSGAILKEAWFCVSCNSLIPLLDNCQ